MRSTPTFATLAALAALAMSAAGCERVSYYSLTGGDDAATSSSTTTGSTATGPAGVTRAEVLKAVGVCALSLYSEAAEAAAGLRDAAAAASADPSKKAPARDAWGLAIDRWQQAEMIRAGAAGPASVPGGKDLRDLVYSWPLVSRCLVEQTLVAGSYEKGDFFASALVNTRGLAAIEYLLFYDGQDNACSATASINSSGTWAAIPPDELAAKKLAYAKAAAADVAVQVAAIKAAWSGDGGFAQELARAGEAGALFSDKLAMNAIADGLFYLDSDVKDLKLGRPLGLVDCAAATCPEAVESRFSRRSRDHIKNNLIGFRRLFNGCDEAGQVGFDDLIAAMGREDLSARMASAIEAAIAAADALPSGDVAESIAQDPAKVKALHAAIKVITDALKTEVTTVLDVELPQQIEGDND